MKDHTNLTTYNLIKFNAFFEKNDVLSRISTRKTANLDVNADLIPYKMYDKKNIIPDYLRIAITRVRLSSHRLKIETGRWSRISREECLCSCEEDIQSEKHVLIDCHLSTDDRIACNISTDISNLDLLFNNPSISLLNVGRLCYRVLSKFNN